MNLSLLCKWWWRLEKESGLWQDIVKHKYMKKDNVSSVKHKQTDSPMWADLLKIKHIYLQGRKMNIKNGKSTSVWKDIWLYDEPLCTLFPVLFKLCEQQDILVHQWLNKSSTITFSRWLTAELGYEWGKIQSDASKSQLDDGHDIASWKLESRGNFSVKSTYNALTCSDGGSSFKEIWKGKIPAKIKIFMWLVANNAILTKDNMIKRNWKGDPSCYFCQQPETVTHLLFKCPVAKVVWATIATCFGASNIPSSFQQSWNWCEKWIPNGKQFHAVGIAAVCWAIWKMRNKICFEGKKLRNPIEIVCHACALIKFWAGLQKEVDKEALIQGVETMFKIAAQLLSENRPPDSQNRMIQDGADNDEDAQALE
jgi:hypothetical protein